MNTDIKERNGTGPRWGLIGAVVSAVGASICCVGPLLLLALGIGGAWVGNLTAMEKYRPFWTVATLIFLGLAFMKVYRKPKKEPCCPGDACRPETGRRNRILLWVVAAFVLGLLLLPYIIPYACAEVTSSPPQAVVTYDPAKVRVERLVEATAKAGFPSTVVPHGGKR